MTANRAMVVARLAQPAGPVRRISGRTRAGLRIRVPDEAMPKTAWYCLCSYGHGGEGGMPGRSAGAHLAEGEDQHGESQQEGCRDPGKIGGGGGGDEEAGGIPRP